MKILQQTLANMQFEPIDPLWQNPTYWVARVLIGWDGASSQYANINVNGECTCSEFKIKGDCLHAQAWQYQQEQMSEVFEPQMAETSIEEMSLDEFNDWLFG